MFHLIVLVIVCVCLCTLAPAIYSWSVRFQVLTAASMMFRAVFWVVYNPEDSSEHHIHGLSWLGNVILPDSWRGWCLSSTRPLLWMTEQWPLAPREVWVVRPVLVPSLPWYALIHTQDAHLPCHYMLSGWWHTPSWALKYQQEGKNNWMNTKIKKLWWHSLRYRKHVNLWVTPHTERAKYTNNMRIHILYSPQYKTALPIKRPPFTIFNFQKKCQYSHQ
jgi:hypothetical protein